jgi:NAD(P)-dependent dehydrogenase (short-subunit alcohol dehydrogenase family)
MSTDAQKVALVTGMSSGIGRASVIALVEAGYRVFGTSRKATTGATLGSIGTVRLDVDSDSAVTVAVEHVLAVGGRIDLLVNNAGFGVVGAAEESSTEQARAIFDTNLFGVTRMVRAVAPAMRRQGGGRIINISSVLGLVPAPYMALYAATKHALEGYSESLDHELRTQGIRVVLIQPAYTRTAFGENIATADMPLSEYREQNGAMKRMLSDVMATADEPELVADVVVRAARASVPRLRYTAGRTARRVARLRRFAPPFLFDRGLRAGMKLDA